MIGDVSFDGRLTMDLLELLCICGYSKDVRYNNDLNYIPHAMNEFPCSSLEEYLVTTAAVQKAAKEAPTVTATKTLTPTLTLTSTQP